MAASAQLPRTGEGDTMAAAATGEASGSSAYLDNAVEVVQRQIDTDIEAMMDAFDALVGLSAIHDKDRFRIAQEKLEAEARADSMVRAAQSLTLLSHSLKLSLLLSQEPVRDEEGAAATESAGGVASDGDDGAAAGGMTLDEEAVMLIERTARSRQQCARLLLELCGKDERREEVGKKAKRAQRTGKTRAAMTTATEAQVGATSSSSAASSDIIMEEEI